MLSRSPSWTATQLVRTAHSQLLRPQDLVGYDNILPRHILRMRISVCDPRRSSSKIWRESLLASYAVVNKAPLVAEIAWEVGWEVVWDVALSRGRSIRLLVKALCHHALHRALGMPICWWSPVWRDPEIAGAFKLSNSQWCEFYLFFTCVCYTFCNVPSWVIWWTLNFYVASR